MAIRTHEIDPGCSLHPAQRGVAVIAPTADPDAFVAALAENNGAHIVGAQLTLVVSGTAGLGPAGFLPCTPCSIAFTPSAAITATYRVVGINQFNQQVTEDVVVAAAVVHTVNAYKEILTITIMATGASANTISVGLSLAAGFKVALPFRPITNLQGGTTLGSFKARLEFVGMTVVPSAATTVFVQTAAGAVSERYATVQFAVAATAGLNWLLLKWLAKGFRPL